MRILARMALAVALASFAALAGAQPEESVAVPPDSASAPAGAFTSEQLDQMLAPIALYPDELLAQVLMAATYPLEVVEAERWSRAHPDVRGEDAVAAADSEDWDPSVKSLVAFPELLQTMSEQLEWTQSVGEAFLGQRDATMQSIQRLRRAAYGAGNLASSDELAVVHEGEDIALDSPSPDMMYVPYYDPRAVYGPWWWPAAPPFYWGPWPDYYVFTGYGFVWGLGVPIGNNFFIGDFDWNHHHVTRNHVHPFYDHDRGHRPTPSTQYWHHDESHRHNVPYRNPLARQEAARPHTGGSRDHGTGVPRPGPAPSHPIARQPPPAQGNPIARPPSPEPQHGVFPAPGQPQQGGQPRTGSAPRTAVPPQGSAPHESPHQQGSAPQPAGRPLGGALRYMPPQPASVPQPVPQPIARPGVAPPQGNVPAPQGGHAPAPAPQGGQAPAPQGGHVPSPQSSAPRAAPVASGRAPWGVYAMRGTEIAQEKR